MTVTRVAIEDCLEFLEPDGSLRDIYVYDTTRDDWQNVWQRLLPLGVELFDDQRVRVETPASLSSIHFDSETYLVKLLTGGVQFNGYFRGGWTIEFDIDPREVQNQQTFDVVLDFMEMLAHTTSKPVILTEEGGYNKRDPIVQIAPSAEVWSVRNPT